MASVSSLLAPSPQPSCPLPTLIYVMIPNPRVQHGKRRPERLRNGLLSSGRYPPGPRSVAYPGRLPSNIERHVFVETRLTAYRLKATA